MAAVESPRESRKTTGMPSAMIMQIWTSAKSASMRGSACDVLKFRTDVNIYCLPESDTSLRVVAD